MIMIIKNVMTFFAIGFQPLNSLFLKLFVSEEDFSHAALAEILRYLIYDKLKVVSTQVYHCFVHRTVFIAIPLLQYVFLSVASNADIGKYCRI